ncbi:MAG: hypothetical protein ACXVNR_00910 [Bacteroidia bacterium]
MNPFKKFQLYFINGVISKTDDVFEQVKAEVLFNFTVFFLITNLPYFFISLHQVVYLLTGVSTLSALAIVLVVLKKTSNLKLATYFFLINFMIQNFGHYIRNNGRMEEQGVLFGLLFIMCGFLLLDRMWGLLIGVVIMTTYVLGLYNMQHDHVLWHVPERLSDPPETGGYKYLTLIPVLLNIYLISEFVKARQKAEKQLSAQKALIEEKQKEIIDSIRYASRIQKSQMPNEKFIEKTLDRLRKK